MRLSELQSMINQIAPEGDIEISPTQVPDPLGGEMGYQVDNFREVIDTLSPLAGLPWFNVEEATVRALENKYANQVSPVVLPQTDFTPYQNLVNRLNQAQDLKRISDILGLAVQEQDPYSVYFRVPDNILTPGQFNDWQERMSKILIMAAAGGGGTFRLAATESGSNWIGWIADPVTYLILVSSLKVAFKVVRFLEEHRVDAITIASMFRAVYKQARDDARQSEDTEGNIPEPPIEEIRKEQREAITAEEIQKEQAAVSVYFHSNGIAGPSVSAIDKCAKPLIVEFIDNGQEVRLSLKRPKYIKGSEEELDVDLGEVDTSSLRQPPKQLPQPEDEERDNE